MFSCWICCLSSLHCLPPMMRVFLSYNGAWKTGKHLPKWSFQGGRVGNPRKLWTWVPSTKQNRSGLLLHHEEAIAGFSFGFYCLFVFHLIFILMEGEKSLMTSGGVLRWHSNLLVMGTRFSNCGDQKIENPHVGWQVIWWPLLGVRNSIRSLPTYLRINRKL